MCYRRKKFDPIFFFICRIITLNLFGSQEGVLGFKIFCKPYTCLGEELVFQRCKKSHLYISIRKKQKQNITLQISKSHEAPKKNSVIHIFASVNFLFSFSSYQAHFSSCHQSGCYIRQSLSRKKKRYNYYIIFSCLEGIFSAFQ